MSARCTPSSSCANCGKGEEDAGDLKTCTGCKMARYCNRECQLAHRPQHKKECKKRAAELHDEKLFKQPPKLEPCPICCIDMPTMDTGRKYQTCCGNYICMGCWCAPVRDHKGNILDDLCPFCRTPDAKTDEEMVSRVKKRMEDFGDKFAIFNYGVYHSKGEYGFPQDPVKAVEFWLRSAKLGHAESYHNIGDAYLNGRGVERDMKKAEYYWEQAAMNGDIFSRFNLGMKEQQAGNMDRAKRHYMIAVKCGEIDALANIQHLYMSGYATSEEYSNAERLYKEYVDEIKSDQRDVAAEATDEMAYYTPY